MKKPLKILARRMFPGFVSENYPRMITFTEYVFEYMDQEGGQYDIVSNLLNYTDVDSTLEKFEFAFKRQYLANFPDVLAADVDLLVKNIRSFYLNKGTEQSFRFLFGALFDATVNFKYPRFNILRTSDGLWYTPQYLVLTDANDNIPPQTSVPDDYNVTKLADQFITGTISGAVAFVDGDVILADEGLTYGGSGAVKGISIVEKEGAFVAGEQILIGDTLIENGSFINRLNFWTLKPAGDPGITSINSTVTITQQLGDVQNRCIYQAVPVEESAQYWLRFSMLSATANQNKVTVGYDIGTNEIYDSANLGTAPVNTTTLLNPIAAGKLKIYITLHNQMTVANQTVTFDGISLVKENTANIPILYIANIASESGILQGNAKWKDQRGFLSEGDFANDREIVLQDGFYYQDFAYEVKSTVSSNRFESIIKDLVHPSGFRMFAEVLPPDDLETYALRECIYNDLIFADANPDTITRSASGVPFDQLFRPYDRVRVINTLSNDGEYIVYTVTPTTITVRPGLSISPENSSGTLVGISAGIGILDLAGTDEDIFLSYFLESTATVPLIFTEQHYSIEYILQLGFGDTWAKNELNREAMNVLVGSWDSLIVNDFNTKATSRFGFISSAEITIT